MKKALLVIWVVPLLWCCSQCANRPKPTQPQDPVIIALQEELREIEYLDQVHRNNLGEPPGYSKFQKDSLWDRLYATDRRNQEKIDSIIAIHGYPGKSLVGEDLEMIAVLVIHHSPKDGNTDYMHKHLTLLQEAAKEGELRYEWVLAVMDRMHIQDAGMTMFKRNRRRYQRDSTLNLDSLHALVGLEPLEIKP